MHTHDRYLVHTNLSFSSWNFRSRRCGLQIRVSLMVHSQGQQLSQVIRRHARLLRRSGMTSESSDNYCSLQILDSIMLELSNLIECSFADTFFITPANKVKSGWLGQLRKITNTCWIPSAPTYNVDLALGACKNEQRTSHSKKILRWLQNFQNHEPAAHSSRSGRQRSFDESTS